jgi:hypothetical protein
MKSYYTHYYKQYNFLKLLLVLLLCYNHDLYQIQGATIQYNSIQKITTPDAVPASSSTELGTSLSISGNGLFACVGNRFESSAQFNGGAVWFYTRDDLSNFTWYQLGPKFSPSDLTPSSWFGTSCSLNYNGDIAVVGASKNSNYIGGSWVIARNKTTNVWYQQSPKLVGKNYSISPSSSCYGNGNCVYQGGSIAIAANASVFVVGGPYDLALIGAAWVFTFNSSTGLWDQNQDKLVNYGGVVGGWQGISVAIDADAKTIFVGGDTLYIYTRSGSIYMQSQALAPSNRRYFGSSLSISLDGNTLVVGSNGLFDQGIGNVGGFYIFTKSSNSTVFQQQGNNYIGTDYTYIPTSYIQQGSSVSISGDGNWIAVGGLGDNNYAGAIWIWSRSALTNNWSVIGKKITTNYTSANALQGYHVALSYDGTILLSVAPYDVIPSGSGSFSVFIGNTIPIGQKCISCSTCQNFNCLSGVCANPPTNEYVVMMAFQSLLISGGLNTIAKWNISSQICPNYSKSNPQSTTLAFINGGNTIINCYNFFGSCIQSIGKLVITSDSISSVIPTEIGLLVSVTHLDLSNNSFFGNIPSEIGNLIQLTYLDLGYNQLQGRVPSEIGLLTNVVVLILHQNQLTGLLPFQMGYMSRLTKLFVQGNSNLQGFSSQVNSLCKNGTITQKDFSCCDNSCSVCSISNSNTCVDCPANYYLNASKFNCIPCHSTCLNQICNITNGQCINCNYNGFTSDKKQCYIYSVVTSSPPVFDENHPPSNLNWGLRFSLVSNGTMIRLEYNPYGEFNSCFRFSTVTYETDLSIYSSFEMDLMCNPSVVLPLMRIDGYGPYGPERSNVVDLNLAITSTNTSSNWTHIAVIGGYLDNDYIGSAWVFTRVGGVWNQKGSKLVGTGYYGGLIIHQGYSVAISSDASTIVVGGYRDNSGIGAIWIYSLSNGIYAQIGNKLNGTGAATVANQGYSVSISFDGNTIASGGYSDGTNDAGAVWIFTKNGNAWVQQNNKLTHPSSSSNTYLGSSVALSSNGSTLVVGGHGDNNNIGAIFIFTRFAGVWAAQGGKYVGSGYVGLQIYQGWAVSISDDGNLVAVGGVGDDAYTGATWIWTRSVNGVWSQYGLKIVGSSYIGRSYQGNSVSLSSNGVTLFVGGYGDNFNQGAVWVFSNPSFISTSCQRPSNTSTTIYSTNCPTSIFNGSSCAGVCANGYSLNSGSLSVRCDNGTLSVATGILKFFILIYKYNLINFYLNL